EAGPGQVGFVQERLGNLAAGRVVAGVVGQAVRGPVVRRRIIRGRRIVVGRRLVVVRWLRVIAGLVVLGGIVVIGRRHRVAVVRRRHRIGRDRLLIRRPVDLVAALRIGAGLVARPLVIGLVHRSARAGLGTRVLHVARQRITVERIAGVGIGRAGGGRGVARIGSVPRARLIGGRGARIHAALSVVCRSGRRAGTGRVAVVG